MTTRIPWIDALKAAAIVAVVWIHAFTIYGVTHPLGVRFLASLTVAAVPAFFFASGFLQYSARPAAWAELRLRLWRLLPPYLLASALALALRAAVLPHALTWREVWWAVCTGSAFGIYYFVPMLCGAIVLGWIMPRVGRLALLAWFVFLAGGWLSLAGRDAFVALMTRSDQLGYWQFRSPLHWWGYFLSGWMVARHGERWRGLIGRRAIPMGAGILSGAVALAAVEATLLARNSAGSALAASVRYAICYGSIAAVMLLFASTKSVPPGVVTLSRLTYPIYLYHLFFIDAARAGLPPAVPAGAANLLKLAAGLLGPLVLAMTVRAALGERSARTLIG
ncbi:MAG: acyltransferase [Deltaproteobacteria bacterium]|nr:acyltransferase [Deltaproteobacteria bacterium]